MNPLLARLAERCGIEPAYDDIRGERHEVDDGALRELLAAMGVDAEDDAAATRSLAALDAAHWRRPLEPVIIWRRPLREPSLELRLPESALSRRLRWRLVEEDGRERSDLVDPAALPRNSNVKIDGRQHLALRLPLEPPRSIGYHTLEISFEGEDVPAATSRLILAPERCHQPESLREGGRAWGVALQTYGLRSARNQGIGDFTDLRDAAELFGGLGAGLIGVQPLHALDVLRPEKANPYHPSSRRFLNVLPIDVEAVDGSVFAEIPDSRARLAALRETEQVDYAGVAAVKLPALEKLYQRFRSAQLGRGGNGDRDFAAFRAERGEPLEAWGAFEALREHHLRRDPNCWGWPVWPEEHRAARSDAVRRFAEAHRERVEWFLWLQWIADRQLAAVGRRCLELGLDVGLCLDRAAGFDGNGFDGWWDSDCYALEARFGAPPNDLHRSGQIWELPPPIPHRLRDAGFEPFIASLRENMRHAGALRLDPVKSLMRAYWVPAGRPATDGTYVRYPTEEILALVALESVRQRCLVVGGDLSPVPDGLRKALQEAGVLSSRVFYFTRRGDGSFSPPADYPRDCVAAVSTHDLPTLTGWWTGYDLKLWRELGIFPDERSRGRRLVERAEDRARLMLWLEQAGRLPESLAGLPGGPAELTEELTLALHACLAEGPPMLFTVRPEDVLGQIEPVHLPGASEDAYPGWRRKLPFTLRETAEDARFVRLARVVGTTRPGRRVGPETGIDPRPLPRATYRLQLHSGFDIDRAAALTEYLDHLGISHAYASPFLTARPGSPHGYDITDHRGVNPELGTEESLERWSAALHAHGMGLVLDLVPNHMGIGSDNAWWMDVLEHGPASEHAEFFDIDWHPAKDELHGRVLLPVLEDHYGSVLARGLLRPRFVPESGSLEIAYHDHRFPLDPATYPELLRGATAHLAESEGDDPRLPELRSLMDALADLPERSTEDPRRRAARARDAALLRARLADLVGGWPALARAIEDEISRHDPRTGGLAAEDRLDALLERQAWRVAYWRVAADEINYRRFFDVNDLAALRQEREEVFDATHGYVLDRVRAGVIDGLRIDHPDGLFDPAGYYSRLRSRLSGGAAGPPPVWVVVEKILASHERLPETWPVHGTTGYEFSATATGLLIDGAAARELETIYHRFIGRRIDFDELAYASKKLILDTALSSELNVLADAIDRISEADRRTRDFTRIRLRAALAELMACFPVYRTYITAGGPSAEDRNHVEWAVAGARRRGRAIDTGVYDFLRSVLLLEAGADRDEAHRATLAGFVGKLQQVTGPVAAKGVEDTSFYVHHRLLALNEVGADPRRCGVSIAAFHHANRETTRRQPYTMLNTSTHDSKRSEDARARLAVLSEFAGRWRREVARFTTLNRSRKRRVEGAQAPSKNDEYAFYQNLLALWPFGGPGDAAFGEVRERLEAATLKAVREAKVHSSWINPHPEYEEAVRGFVQSTLDPAASGPFLEAFDRFAAPVARAGLFNSLTLQLLKLTSPGVPDLYQGTELWRFSLVDPDNRRPVDFERCERMLRELTDFLEVDDSELPARVSELVETLSDGRAKLYLTWRALRLRRELPELFGESEYGPLAAEGERAEHVVAFARRDGDRQVIVVAPRLVATLCDLETGGVPLGEDAWGATSIGMPGPGSFRDILSGRRFQTGPEASGSLRVADLLAVFPAALLVSG